jgi:chromosome segregation ATPase
LGRRRDVFCGSLREKTTEKILKAIEGVDAKLETIKEKLATHDTRISTLDTRLASLDSEFRRLETLVSVIQADVRAQGLDIQRNSILAPAPITRKTKA